MSTAARRAARQPVTPLRDLATASDAAIELCMGGVLDLKEAAVLARVSRAQLYRLMDSGQMPYVKHGRRRRIPKLVLARWLAGGLRGGGAP